MDSYIHTRVYISAYIGTTVAYMHAYWHVTFLTVSLSSCTLLVYVYSIISTVYMHRHAETSAAHICRNIHTNSACRQSAVQRLETQSCKYEALQTPRGWPVEIFPCIAFAMFLPAEVSKAAHAYAHAHAHAGSHYPQGAFVFKPFLGPVLVLELRWLAK
jgi:hypothetical protein